MIALVYADSVKQNNFLAFFFNLFKREVVLSRPFSVFQSLLPEPCTCFSILTEPTVAMPFDALLASADVVYAKELHLHPFSEQSKLACISTKALSPLIPSAMGMLASLVLPSFPSLLGI